jgi:hypothetical protein
MVKNSNPPMNQPSFRQSLWLPLALTFAALIWRATKAHFALHDVLANFSPWIALAFAGSAVLPRLFAWWLIPALLIACDSVAMAGDIRSMWLVYACLGLAAYIGGQIRSGATIAKVLFGTVACSVGFYVITSSQAWLLNPVYAKSLSGWMQAMTLGDPAWQPQAWVFGLRSLASDLAFSSLLIVAYNLEAPFRSQALLPIVASGRKDDLILAV